MPKFEVVTPHTDAGCLKALDDIVAHNPSLLQQCWFACNTGDHTGYALLEAKNETEARNLLPAALRAKARVIAVEQFTPQQVRSFHTPQPRM
jgi:hypothetical protein